MPVNTPSPIPGLPSSAINVRPPRVNDGSAIARLVEQTGVLDRNSTYCYLLLCRDFAETCVVAELDGKVVGFATAYRPPTKPDCLFVWQIGIDASVRRCGLALRMLQHLLALPASANVRFVEANVAPTNNASRRLFHKLAESLQVPCLLETGFPADLFGSGDHEEEELLRIGPLTPPTSEG